MCAIISAHTSQQNKIRCTVTQDGLAATSAAAPGHEFGALLDFSPGIASQHLLLDELMEVRKAAAVSSKLPVLNISQLQQILSCTMQQCSAKRTDTQQLLSTQLNQTIKAAYDTAFGAAAAAAADDLPSPGADLLSAALDEFAHPAHLRQSLHAPLLQLHGLPSHTVQLSSFVSDSTLEYYREQQHKVDVFDVWLVADSSQPQEYVPARLQHLVLYSHWGKTMWRHGRSMPVRFYMWQLHH